MFCDQMNISKTYTFYIFIQTITIEASTCKLLIILIFATRLVNGKKIEF